MSLTLNGVKAMIIFHDTDKPTIHWELVIESGKDNASIDGCINVDTLFKTSNPVPSPVPSPAPSPAPSSAPTFCDFNKSLNKFIADVERSVSTKEKAKCAQILYDYITNDALDYIKCYEKLKQVCIERAKSFKKDCKEFPELIASLDAFLTAVGEPFTQETSHNCTAFCSKEQKVEKYVDECGYTWPAFVGKSDDEERLILMKKLFEKEKLVFTPDIMQIYYNSEVQTVRVNRYKKMMLFINAYKNIDGETNYL